MTKQSWIILLTLLTLLAGSWFYTTYWCPWDTPDLLQTAQVSYVNGEHGTTIAQRKDSFNLALSTYQNLEEQYYPENGTGKLYFNLGNAYYQLEQYPWAALYYYRAQKLLPREEKPAFNLALTLEKLQQPQAKPPTIWEKIFLIGTYISIPEALQILTLAIFLIFLVMTLMIWNPKKYLKLLAIVLTGFALYLAAALGYQKYIAPLNAVAIKATPVYRDAGTQYSLVMNEPLPAGAKLDILEILPDGEWIKIQLPQGPIGFVPIESIRII